MNYQVPHEQTGKLIVSILEKYVKEQGVITLDSKSESEINYITPSQMLQNTVSNLITSQHLKKLMKSICEQHNLLSKESIKHHTTLYAISSEFSFINMIASSHLFFV